MCAGAGTLEATDTSGAVVLGKDYLTGEIGETSADFHGTSFEGTGFAWVFRSFGQVNLSLADVSANPSSSNAPAIGFFKGETLQNSHIHLISTTVSGNWSSPQLVVASGAWPPIWWTEESTYTAANNPWIAGKPVYVDSLAAQSGIESHAYYVGINGPVSQGKPIQ